MIPPQKKRAALLAINAVLVEARAMAHENVPYRDLADVLDSAEYLPMLMLEDINTSEEFRKTLESICQKFPRFTRALQRFDER